jgi:Kdo2-lipid IVA lauroyltransferase/acyltransferase
MSRNKERQAAVTWLMPLGTLLQFMLPRWVAARIAYLAGVLTYHFDRRGRERFMDNCRHVMGADTPELELRAAARRLFVHLVTNYLDLLRVPVLKRRVTTLVEFDRRVADQWMAEGRGVVIVTAHLGNYDLAGTYLAALGYPISAVIEPVPRGWAKTFNRYRGATAMETIPLTDRSAIARALLRHRMLALVSDRDLTGNGILCPAFDSYRHYPKGPAAYALRLKSRLVVACCVFQHKPGRPPYLIELEPLEFVPTGDMDVDVPAYTRSIAAAVNEMIRKHADQWLVFNTGWQQKP